MLVHWGRGRSRTTCWIAGPLSIMRENKYLTMYTWQNQEWYIRLGHTQVSLVIHYTPSSTLLIIECYNLLQEFFVQLHVPIYLRSLKFHSGVAYTDSLDNHQTKENTKWIRLVASRSLDLHLQMRAPYWYIPGQRGNPMYSSGLFTNYYQLDY